MPSSLGPFDRRNQRTRCLNCVRKHLKVRTFWSRSPHCSICSRSFQCEEGFPCKRCLRTGRPCALPKAEKSTITIGDTFYSATHVRSRALPLHAATVIMQSIAPDPTSRYLTHFHSSFLRSNVVIGRPWDEFQDVQSLLQDSPGLYSVAIAVGALDSRTRSCCGHPPHSASALHYYKAAISAVQPELAEPNLRTNETVLWSTFFLGIFEVGYTPCLGSGAL